MSNMSFADSADVVLDKERDNIMVLTFYPEQYYVTSQLIR